MRNREQVVSRNNLTEGQRKIIKACLRTDRYTLAHIYENEDWKLFNLKKDPEQLQSICDDPEYTEIQTWLKQQIKDLRSKYGVEQTDLL